MAQTATVDVPTKPLPPVTVHFLGTCSGGGPIISRNCSSLAVDFGHDIWLFDAADGTLPRLHQSSLKLTNISRIFITHLHADHVLGLVSILTTIMSGIGMDEAALEKLKAQGVNKKPVINIYGTRGLRRLIRTTLEITAVTLAGALAVHELLSENETEGSVPCSAEDLHPNEAVGMDLHADENGVWPEVLAEGQGKNGKGWAVSAGPIEHRVPCLGYILQEPTPILSLDTASLIPLLQANGPALQALSPPISHPLSLLSHLTSLPPPPPFTLPSGETIRPPEPSGVPPRKLVIFGDCSGGTKNPIFETMCENPSLLIHECTNASVPELIQRGEKGRKVRMKGMDDGLVKRSEEQTGKTVGKDDHHHDDSKEEQSREEREEAKKAGIRKKAQGRGHSTPDEVGEFAKRIQARRVVVNHFSAMYSTIEAFPSILLPMSPYCAPSPYPPPRIRDQIPPTLPLSAAELHLRLIMQSICDQIDTVWHGGEVGPDASPPKGRAVPARDFMIMRVPGHELTTQEKEELSVLGKETNRITEEWKANGGIWLGEGEEKRWVGVDPQS